ncbi:MAG: trigger factor [Gammaproteobacteria bacterium]|nr:trigger factor [Gammaproteobacteria bacterium]
MEVSLSDTGGLTRRLEVAVPATEVAREVQQRLKQLSRTARLKGFRPGKAPLAVITKQFGDQVRAEVVSDLMRSSFAQAVNQEKLRPAGGPRIEPLALPPDADLKYAAHFEVLPEIKVNPPEQLAIERPAAEVTESDVDSMIENMRAQRPVFTAVERAATAGDRVVFDYQARIGGRLIEDGDLKDVRVVLGSGQAMPELEAGLTGTRAGEERTIQATFPAQHPHKRLAGQEAELRLSIKAVEEQSLPAVDEEFFRTYGVEQGGLEEMRAQVRKSMERELAGVIRQRVRAQVLDALYQSNPLPVPRAMLEEQVQALQIDTARRLGIRDVNQLPPPQSFEEPARRRVTLGLLVSQIVQNEGLKVERARLQERLGELTESYPDPEQARRAYLQNQDAMRQIEAAVLEEQVIDWVLARAQVTERAASFKELTGFGTAEAAHEHDHAHDHEPLNPVLPAAGGDTSEQVGP